MSFFSWEKRYELGVDSIDGDHRVLVGLINELYVAMTKGEAKTSIQAIVAKLVDYARIHFKREEHYMQSINYSEQIAHISEHNAFTKKVDGFVEKLDTGISNISIEVITFLRDWLINHIQLTDKKLGEELKKGELFDI
jgi:hemerythrin-like metal-binding protein